MRSTERAAGRLQSRPRKKEKDIETERERERERDREVEKNKECSYKIHDVVRDLS